MPGVCAPEVGVLGRACVLLGDHLVPESRESAFFHKGLPEIDACQQVSIATGSKPVLIAGQVAWEAGGDVAAQVEQCYRNVGTALAGVGGSFDDVAKVTVYVVDRTPDKMPLLMEGLGRAVTKLGITSAPPATLISVAALDVPEHLVEIEATAVLDRRGLIRRLGGGCGGSRLTSVSETLGAPATPATADSL